MGIKFANKINTLTPSGIRLINEKALALESNGKKVYHFELGRPDFDTPDYIKEACIESIKSGDVHYTSNYGKIQLRQQIADYLQVKKNIPVQAENILVTVGLAEAIFDVLTVLLEPGDEILVPDPVWMNYINIPKLLGAIPVTYNLKEENDYQLDINEIKSKTTDKTKAIVIVSPHNPTGSLLNENTIKDLADFAINQNLAVISDEVYERLVYSDEKHLSIASLPNMFERTVTLNGFSKTYSMTGWRIGYVAASEQWILALNKIHQINTTSATSFVQSAAIVALSKENGQVEQMREEYKRRRDFVYKRINEIDGLSCKEPEGAFYAFINIKKLGQTADKFVHYLLDTYGVAMVPGTVFGENGEGYIRMSFASSMEDLEVGLDLLEKCVKEIIKT